MFSRAISAIQSVPDNITNYINSKVGLDRTGFIFSCPAGSYMKTDEHGNVSLSASASTGIMLSREHHIATIYGKYVNIVASQFRINTKPDGFIWNGYYFNPDIYKNNIEVLTKDGEYVKMFKEAPDFQFKAELQSMLKNVGIE